MTPLEGRHPRFPSLISIPHPHPHPGPRSTPRLFSLLRLCGLLGSGRWASGCWDEGSKRLVTHRWEDGGGKGALVVQWQKTHSEEEWTHYE